jgi:L-amino acid N-acyltransferase YncA
MIEFRKTTQQDMPELCELFNYYITHTTATFYTHALTEEQLSNNLMPESSDYACFTIFQDTKIAGFVSLTQHKARQAYVHSGEISIYLYPSFAGKGIGSKAIDFIELYALSKNFHTLIATVCGENSNSIKLFEKNHYCRCAYFKEVGYKFGRFLDIVSLQKLL